MFRGLVTLIRNTNQMDTVYFAKPEEQIRALEELKQKVGAEKILRDAGFTDSFLRKCLWAKHNDVKHSVSLLKNYAEWYVKTKGSAKTRLSIKDVHAFLLTGIFVAPLGDDKDGFPIIYMRPNQYFPGKIPHDHVIKALVFMLEHFTMDEKAAKYGFTFICDMTNWGWSNFGASYAERFFNILQGRFPIRLRKFILVNPPGMFNMVWKIIRPMMKDEFASKWSLIKMEDLFNFIEPLVTPKELGGTKTVDMIPIIKGYYEEENLRYEEIDLEGYNWRA
jgi:hypothetical protein